MATQIEQSSSQPPALELDDIQGTVLRERPRPYVGAYFFLHLGEAVQGRELLRRLLPYVASAANWWTPKTEPAINLALTYNGLKALGVPQASLDSFPDEFRAGMAARAAILGDDGESAPAHWDAPLGTGEVHIALILASHTPELLAAALTTAKQALQELPAVAVLGRIDVGLLPSGLTHFGYHDGIDEPLIEGSGSSGYPGQGPVIKAGEFLLGYLDEQGQLPPMPQPEVLGRNGTYLAFRNLYERVADFRRFLRENAATDDEQAYLAAKVVGRWPSGAPLILARSDGIPSGTTISAITQPIPRDWSVPLGRTSGASTRVIRWRAPSPTSTSTACCGAGRPMAHHCPMAPWRTTAPCAASFSSSWGRVSRGRSSSSCRSGSTTAPSWAWIRRRTRSWATMTAPARSPSPSVRSAVGSPACTASW
jgi:deferrochelatase/peroxidase EfeB